MNIKDNGKDWQSKKYRRWIRDNCTCATCGQLLSDEKEDFITHHHKHARKKDYMLVPLCLKCHNDLHSNEPKFKEDNLVSDESLDRWAMSTLATYLVENGLFDKLAFSLADVAKEIDEDD